MRRVFSKLPVPAARTDSKYLICRIKSLEDSLKIAGDYAEKLERRIACLEMQKKMLIEEEKRKNERQRKDILEGKEIALRDMLIKNLAAEAGMLRKKFSRISELEIIYKDGCIPAVPIGNFDKDEILGKDKEFGINGSVVFFKGARGRDSSGDAISHKAGRSLSPARILIALQPKAVIADLGEDEARMLRNADICVISPKNISTRRYYDFLGVERMEFDKEAGKCGCSPERTAGDSLERFINGRGTINI